MAKPVLSDPRFFSEEAAFDYVEGQLWPEGPVCPHCGRGDRIGRLATSVPSPQEEPRRRRAGRPAQVLRLPGKAFTVARVRFSRIATFPCVCGCRRSTCFAPRRKASLRASFSGCWLRHENGLAPWPPYPRNDDRRMTRPGSVAGKTVETDETVLGNSTKTQARPEGRKGQH